MVRFRLVRRRGIFDPGSCTKPVVTLEGRCQSKQRDVALAPEPMVVVARPLVCLVFSSRRDLKVGFPNRIIIGRSDPEMGARSIRDPDVRSCETAFQTPLPS